MIDELLYFIGALFCDAYVIFHLLFGIWLLWTGYAPALGLAFVSGVALPLPYIIDRRTRRRR